MIRISQLSLRELIPGLCDVALITLEFCRWTTSRTLVTCRSLTGALTIGGNCISVLVELVVRVSLMHLVFPADFALYPVACISFIPREAGSFYLSGRCTLRMLLKSVQAIW